MSFSAMQKDNIVEVTDLHKSYAGCQVLRSVSLTATRGEVVAIVGSSGSGKSTLLRCLNLLEIPDSGYIRIGEEAIRFDKSSQTPKLRQQQLSRLRLGIGMVFQNFNLWSHMTVMENVIEAPIHVLRRNKLEAIDEAEALLAKVNMLNKRNHYPAHLSGGQQQRAAIARALAIKPMVILLDEPTSSLDPELVGEVLNVMQQLAEEGKTMLIATHEIGFANNVSSKVIFLNEGVIEESGAPQDVLGNPSSERLKKFLSTYTGRQ